GVAFSPDGQRLAFVSSADGLTSTPIDPSLLLGPDGRPAPDSSNRVYVRDLARQTTSPVSVTLDGRVASGSMPVFSPDGKSLAFVSGAMNLAGNPGDPSTTGSNLYVRDLGNQTTALASATPDDKLGNGSIQDARFVGDGQTLLFEGTASNLSPL